MRDEGKPRLSLVPTAAMWMTAQALTYGVKKHGKYSFKENGFPTTVMADKVLRHMFEYLDGKDADDESGLHPLAHAAADLAILLDIIARNNHQDDRFKKATTGYDEYLEDEIFPAGEPIVVKPWTLADIDAYLVDETMNICGTIEGKTGFFYIFKKDGKIGVMDQEQTTLVEFSDLTFDVEKAIIHITEVTNGSAKN